MGRGEAFRRIIYGNKLEIYDRNASPSCKEETGFLFYFWTSANVWVRNPVSGAGFLGFLGRGEAFRRIIYGKKLEIYDRNASPSCKEETGFLFYLGTSANIWGRNPVSGENKKPGFYFIFGLRQIFGEETRLLGS